MDDKLQVVEKKKPLPTVLEETLLVEITDPSVGTDALGNKRQMTMSRAAYETQRKELQMEIVKVLKPEGVTMKQHLAAPAPKAAPAAPVKATAKPAAPKSKTGAPKPKPAAPSEGMTADEMREAIERQSMEELLNSTKTE